MKVKDFFNWWLPVVVWCGIIFGLSSIPTLPTPKIYWWDFVLKKSAHIIEYGILYFLVFRAINKLQSKNEKLKTTIKNLKIDKTKKTDWITPFLFSFLYAVSDEYHQSFVRGRHMATMDVGFDFLGMLISFWRINHLVPVSS